MRALRSAADPGGSFFDSSVGCDWYCAEACCARRSAANRNGTKGMDFMLASIQLLQLLADVACGDGEVRAVARDDLLSLAAEDEAEELAHLRIEGPARRLVDVDVRVARQRVAAVGDVVGGERNGGTIRGARDRDDLEPGIAGTFGNIPVFAGVVYVHLCAPAAYLFFLLLRFVQSPAGVSPAV